MTGPEGSEKFQAASQNGLSFGSEGVLHPFGIVGLNLAAHHLGGGVHLTVLQTEIITLFPLKLIKIKSMLSALIQIE